MQEHGCAPVSPWLVIWCYWVMIIYRFGAHSKVGMYICQLLLLKIEQPVLLYRNYGVIVHQESEIFSVPPHNFDVEGSKGEGVYVGSWLRLGGSTKRGWVEISLLPESGFSNRMDWAGLVVSMISTGRY